MNNGGLTTLIVIILILFVFYVIIKARHERLKRKRMDDRKWFGRK